MIPENSSSLKLRHNNDVIQGLRRHSGSYVKRRGGIARARMKPVIVPLLGCHNGSRESLSELNNAQRQMMRPQGMKVRREIT